MKQKVFGSDFQVLDESWYSSLKNNQKPCLNKVLQTIFPSDPKTIVDANAHIGADTINFCQIFKSSLIMAVEINPEAVTCLLSNVENFRKQVSVCQADILDFIDLNQHADVYYFDPPWGGRDYVSRDSVELFLSNKPIGEICRMVTPLTKNILIKVPKNFDFKSFSVYGFNYNVYDISTFYGKLAYKLIHVKTCRN